MSRGPQGASTLNALPAVTARGRSLAARSRVITEVRHVNYVNYVYVHVGSRRGAALDCAERSERSSEIEAACAREGADGRFGRTERRTPRGAMAQELAAIVGVGTVRQHVAPRYRT